MIRKARKCINFFIILSAIYISCMCEVMKCRRKRFCILFISFIITIIFVDKNVRHAPIKRRHREINFVDILHRIPIGERRYYVWKRAFEVLNNHSSGNSISVATNNESISRLINNTIDRYKV